MSASIKRVLSFGKRPAKGVPPKPSIISPPSDELPAAASAADTSPPKPPTRAISIRRNLSFRRQGPLQAKPESVNVAATNNAADNAMNGEKVANTGLRTQQLQATTSRPPPVSGSSPGAGIPTIKRTFSWQRAHRQKAKVNAAAVSRANSVAAGVVLVAAAPTLIRELGIIQCRALCQVSAAPVSVLSAVLHAVLFPCPCLSLTH